MDPDEPTAGLWEPDNVDGSGWAEVSWASAVRGSRYHYRHGEPFAEAHAARPPYYRVVTRLESATLGPHENSYFVPANMLADFLEEVVSTAGAETIWHIESRGEPPPESRITQV